MAHRRQGPARTAHALRTVLCLLWLAGFACLVSPRVGAEKEMNGAAPRTLAAGSAAEREIFVGETQTFEVELAAGRFLPVSIQKDDLRISVNLYGPGGRQLGEHVAESYGTLDLSLLTDSAGAHIIEVRSLEKESTGRRYTLKLGHDRLATGQDRQYQEAASAFGVAARLRAEWEVGALRKAIGKFNEARWAWLAAGQPARAADALTVAAETHFVLGQYRQALRAYDEAAAAGALARDRRRELAARSNCARVRSYLGQNDRAQKELEAVLNEYERRAYAAGSPLDKRALADALGHMGEVWYSKGNPLKAANYFRRALSLWEEVGDRRGEAPARLNLGYTTSSSGEQEAAGAHFERALKLARAVGERRVEALALTAQGVLHSLSGREQLALNLHQESLGISRATGDRQSEGVALNGLGQAYEDMGDWSLALDHYTHALELFLDNESLDFASGTQYRVARIYRLKGDIPQALPHYRRSIELSRAANKRRTEAYALTDMASIYYSTGRRRETLGQYNQLLDIYREIGDRRGQAIVLGSIGDLFFASDDKPKALSYYRRALPLTQAAGDREAEIATLYNVAVSARDCGAFDEALSSVKQSVELIEAVRAYAAGSDFRSSYLALVHKHYGLHVELLMRLERQRPGKGFAAAALLMNERARARSLLDLLEEAGTGIGRGADPGLLEQERQLRQMLRDRAQHRLRLSRIAQTEAESEEVARHIRQLAAEYQRVRARLQEQAPRYASLTQPRLLTLEEMQAELRNENTLLLQYALGEQRSHLWVVTADSLTSYDLPPRAELEEVAQRVYNLLTARQRVGQETTGVDQESTADSDRKYEKETLALSRTLLGPVAKQLSNQRLLVAVEGVLQYLPFDSLPVPDTAAEDGELPLLVSRHEIVSLPSLSTLAAIRRARPRAAPAGKLVTVFADPVFDRRDPRVAKTSAAATSAPEPQASEALRVLRGLDGFGGAAGFPRLRHTVEEAEAILAQTSPFRRMIVTGFEASREAAVSPTLGQYRIVHFATHGAVNGEQPELTGIILSMVNRDGEPADGFLQLQDIYNLDLSAELVVLSACNTALGKDVRGEGLVGLTRGFMSAGSKSVVASLWKVDDAATAELMRHFYKAMLKDGQPPAAALREAKEALRRQKRWRAPFYWAAFVLQGEYREPVVTPDGGSWAGTLVLLAVLACGGLYVAWQRGHLNVACLH